MTNSFRVTPTTKKKSNRGMTYVELIVVLGIFSMMTSVAMFNYRQFQEKVDIKTLSNDIALKIVEAQKSAMSGKWAPASQQDLIDDEETWKPSYGVRFAMSTPKNFITYVDVDEDEEYSGSDTCPDDECLSQIFITKSSYVSALGVTYKSGAESSLNDLHINFTRPDSSAVFNSSSALNTSQIDYVSITVSSPNVSTEIKVYPSGRVQID